MQIELIRDPHQPRCTLGRLSVNGRSFHTLEPPWVENLNGGKSGAIFNSCVAEGEYRLLPHECGSGERCWALVNPSLDVYYLPQDVPHGREEATRTLVLIHAAYFVHDLIGGIGPGKQRTKNQSQWMVTESRAAMNELRQLLSGKLDHTISIRRQSAA